MSVDTYRCVFTDPDGHEVACNPQPRAIALLTFGDLVNPAFAALGGKSRVRVVSELTWLTSQAAKS